MPILYSQSCHSVWDQSTAWVARQTGAHIASLRSARHSKRGPESSIFYIQSEDILTKQGQNFSPRFETRCTALTLP